MSDEGEMVDIFLDDTREPGDVYTESGKWVVARDIETVKSWLYKGLVRNMSLDHDLGLPETGYDLLCWMEATNTWPKGDIVVHSKNVVGRQNMLAVLANRERVQKLMAK